MIAGRYDRNAFHVEGAIRFQGQSTCGIGYVTQHDYLLPFLTVRETLMFAARLRMSENSTQATSLISSLICNNDANIKKCHEVVEAIILDLGLKECAETNIGDDNITSKKRGISGGEKRRVSVAVQIITDPQVTFQSLLFSYRYLLSNVFSLHLFSWRYLHVNRVQICEGSVCR